MCNWAHPSITISVCRETTSFTYPRPVRTKDLISQLKKEPNPLKSKMLLLRYVTDRLEKKSQSVVLVGGQAVETYTGGEFTTGDIDITTSDKKTTEQILTSIGFQRIGMIWLNEQIGIAIHIVGMFPRNLAKTRTIEVGPYDVRLVGVEDLIIDRLAAAKVWNRPSDIEQAKILFANFKKQLDMDYLTKRASDEHVLEVLDQAKQTETHSST